MILLFIGSSGQLMSTVGQWHACLQSKLCPILPAFRVLCVYHSAYFVLDYMQNTPYKVRAGVNKIQKVGKKYNL